jgi:hypothetical protein
MEREVAQNIYDQPEFFANYSELARSDSSLASHYIEDFGRLAKMVYRALVPDARFVFTSEHPDRIRTTLRAR